MGHLNTTSELLAAKSTIRASRSKGERLGWKTLAEQKKRSLRDIVGEGEKVEPSKYSFIDSSIKQMIP